MEIGDLKPGMYVRDGRALLRISSVYPTRVTAQVLLEGRPMKSPVRTTVRTYAADEVELFDDATDGQIKRLREVYA